VSDHPVYGVKVGFAEIFLMPQPPLLTTNKICLAAEQLVDSSTRQNFFSEMLRERVWVAGYPHIFHRNSTGVVRRYRAPGGYITARDCSGPIPCTLFPQHFPQDFHSAKALQAKAVTR